METWQVIIVTLVATVIAVKFLEFLSSMGKTDERDEIIETLQVLSAELQIKHEKTKLRTREIQQKYVDCMRGKIDLQLKYDELADEKELL